MPRRETQQQKNSRPMKGRLFFYWCARGGLARCARRRVANHFIAGVFFRVRTQLWAFIRLRPPLETGGAVHVVHRRGHAGGRRLKARVQVDLPEPMAFFRPLITGMFLYHSKSPIRSSPEQNRPPDTKRTPIQFSNMIYSIRGDHHETLYGR